MKMLPDMQERLEYVRSLRDNVRVTCEEDLSLEQKVRRHKRDNDVVNYRIQVL